MARWPHPNCREKCELSGSDCCARTTMANQSDFLAQRGMVEEMIVAAVHIFIFYPKFYCELNFIMNFYGAAKRYARKNCDYSWAGLQRTLSLALASISVKEICRYARKAQQYMDVYLKGLRGKQAEYAVRKYWSHRRVPNSVLMDINALPIG